MVRTAGLEPALSYEKQIFIPLRLSPPPGGVRGLDYPFAIAKRIQPLALGATRLVSTPSKPAGPASLGSGLA
jgi:hypothetical protein